MIKKLTVKNYKSLKDVTVPFQPLTVLAGPNASGKTNILDALSLVCDLVQAKDALASRGKDFRLLVWGGLNETVSIIINRTFATEGKGEEEFEHSIEIKAENYQLVVEKEHCLLLPRHELLFERKGPNGFTMFRKGTTHGERPVSPRLSAFSHIPSDHPELIAIKEALSDCVFYDFIPWQMKQWQNVKRETRLAAAGENIAALLHSIQRAESPLYQNILERFRAALPRAVAIETDLTENGNPPQTYVQLRESGLEQPIKSFSISDGTYRILGILLALFSPNPARLVAIEGPEASVHPYLLGTIADYLKIASKKRQVIVTTHSPEFIKHFSPENLVIVEMKDGATQCRPVVGRRGLREALKVLDLGEMYYSGHLGGVP